MNIENLQQIAEIAKNINVVFDGKLNSATLSEMTHTITQYLLIVQVKSFLVNLMWVVGVVVSAYLIGRQLLKLGEKE